MFSPEQFITDCRAALAEDRPHSAVRELVAQAVSEPAAVLRILGEPSRAGVDKLYHAPDLTILNVVWAPRYTVMPHNHNMWAVIGIYTGREDNIFWRRLVGEEGGRIEAAGAKALSARCRAAWREHHSLRDQPHLPPQRCHPCLWRRSFRRAAQRMGPGDALGTPGRRGADPAPSRGSQRRPRQRLTSDPALLKPSPSGGYGTHALGPAPTSFAASSEKPTLYSPGSVSDSNGDGEIAAL